MPISLSGSLNLSGSLTTTGTITATTLVVQTITSSISSITGSTNFGSLSSDTHKFTGSLNVTGALYVTTGSVGIGTLNPSSPLEIYASSNSKLVLNATLNTSSYQNQIDFKNAGTSSAFIQSGKNPDNTAIGLAFGTTTEVMRITGSTLYVGITGSVYYSSPSLVVGSTLATSVPLQIVSDASGRNIRLYNAEYNGSTLGSTLRLGFITGSGNTPAVIQAYALGESTTGSLILNPSGGNVGIGYSNPNAFVASSGYGNLVVGNGSGDQGVTIFAGTTGKSGLMFADAISGPGAYTGYVLYNHSTDAMELATGGGTPRITISSSGVKFQSGASSLNYYEEGIYTPTLTMSISGTVTASAWYKLYYTRIGRLVHIFGEIRLTSVSSPVGVLNISLPYTSAPDGNSGGGAANLLARGASSPVESFSIGTINSSIYMYLAANQTTMQLYYLNNGSNSTVDGATMISGNEEIGINMTYLTS